MQMFVKLFSLCLDSRQLFNPLNRYKSFPMCRFSKTPVSVFPCVQIWVIVKRWCDSLPCACPLLLCVMSTCLKQQQWELCTGLASLLDIADILRYVPPPIFLWPKFTEHDYNVLPWYWKDHWLYLHLLAWHACLSIESRFCVLVWKAISCKTKVVWTEILFL